MENEKRLIDANALMERLKFKRRNSEVGLHRGLQSAMTQCEKAPTVDAVEVVHGEWTIIEDDWNDETIYECSVCKEAFVTLDGEPMENPWNYCPNCGAKMDGDGNG